MKKGVCNTRIKKMRLEKGFSQDYMAMRMGIAQSNYAKMENGHHDLTVIKLVQIADIFNLNPTKLFEEIIFDYYLDDTLQLELLETTKKIDTDIK